VAQEAAMAYTIGVAATHVSPNPAGALTPRANSQT
jgi:hypothetical protein